MSERPKNFERSWRILEYLRRNSDPEHYVTRAELLNDPVMHRYVKGKETSYHKVLQKGAEKYLYRPGDCACRSGSAARKPIADSAGH